MESYAVDHVVESERVPEQVSVSPSQHAPCKLANAVKVLTRLDLDLTYSSDKLSNLHVLLMHLLALDIDLDPTLEGDSKYFSTEFVGKTLELEYLSFYLDAEVREVAHFLDNLPAEIVDAHSKISSCRDVTEVYVLLEEKLHNCEESLKHSQDQISEVNLHLTKLLGDLEAVRYENREKEKDKDLSEDNQLSNIDLKHKMRRGRLPRYVLRMLEKSLAREVALEKKLSGSRRSEEDLKRKLHYTEQVTFHMEEAAEVVWGRFLEAENASEVLMGISKDLLGQHQIVQFNLNSLLQHEANLRSQLEVCLEQLSHKDIAIQKLESISMDYQAKSSEVLSLRERLRKLEELLAELHHELENANGSCEEYEQQLHEMESFMESLKESTEAAESRADAAEVKVTQLTDTNVELAEEVNFLKGSVASKTEKVSMLEKQVRDLEIQLQNMKASSEVGQEQQNMLYTAIWDMEKLIEDLKSKVLKAETKNDTVEEQCVMLSEANSELDEEVSLLRAKIEKLETCLEEANDSKSDRAKEINLRVKVVMDMVMQLAFERERIQKQLCSLAKEKMYLVEKLREAKGYSMVVMSSNGDLEGKERSFSYRDPSDGTISEETMSPPSTRAVQAGIPSMLFNCKLFAPNFCPDIIMGFSRINSAH
ncbi:hypothetical protein CDL15_Pgr009502 [Punica granatum]|uniref:WIT1/2 N-terminal helical bundle domain-containing protein n=1 Tax=Punica granatum TaxID=22663 RepID=A0A218WTL3_PUNGR|nr:hypothetical protein CDL15_Pgr009502 [Punica granatum]